MSPPSSGPLLYQINTRVWLRELSSDRPRPLTLDDVPDATLDAVAEQGFDWIWLLGVWRTGEAGRHVSRTNEAWRPGYRETLGSDLREEDIVGSPFAIIGYEVHPDFGGAGSLSRMRERLRSRGLKLLLDFVPNHTALDHPWVQEHPEYFIQGSEQDLQAHPERFRQVSTSQGTRAIAYGRDPYSGAWLDTFQLNHRHPGLRSAMKKELLRVASQCDGVRCDMAMLLLPEVIAQTWGATSAPADGAAPADSSFWPEAISEVHQSYPNFTLLAEVYWDLEWELQQQGFDYTYDKRLYDRLLNRNASAVRQHLVADAAFQQKLVRFLENHDEPRAAAAFPAQVYEPAAVITYLTPGLRLFHEGQLEGRRVKLSIHLGRRPDEAVDHRIRSFCDQLLQCLGRREIRTGEWRLHECLPGWAGDETFQQCIAFSWRSDAHATLFVVANYSDRAGRCHVRLPWQELSGRKWRMNDLFHAASYEGHGDDLLKNGLYLDLPAWGYHVFEILE